VYIGDKLLDGPDSPPSSYSQSSSDDPIEGVTFDLDYTMMLPLSLPGTPFDLEADIAEGLEQLRNSPVDVQPPVLSAATTLSMEPEQQPEEEEVVVVEHPQQQQQQQQVVDDVFSPFSPTFPSSSSSSSSHSPTSPSYPYINEEKTLKSKWSTSTLGSIREEHERRGGASAKLRLYFTEHSPLKSNNNNNNKRAHRSKKTLTSPISSLSSLSPLGRKTPAVSSSSSSSPSPPPPPPAAATTGVRSPSKAHHHRHHVRGFSDVMVIGYGHHTHGTGGGVRRRGSVTNSVSDAGSEESSSSTSSSGLRRKPIPVEMFLRSAV